MKPDASLPDAAAKAGDSVDSAHLRLKQNVPVSNRFLIVLPDGVPPQPDGSSFQLAARRTNSSDTAARKVLSARLSDGTNSITTVAWISYGVKHMSSPIANLGSDPSQTVVTLSEAYRQRRSPGTCNYRRLTPQRFNLLPLAVPRKQHPAPASGWKLASAQNCSGCC